MVFLIEQATSRIGLGTSYTVILVLTLYLFKIIKLTNKVSSHLTSIVKTLYKSYLPL